MDQDSAEGCLRGFPLSGTSSPEATSVAIFVITVAEGWLTRPQPLRGLFFVVVLETVRVRSLQALHGK